MARRGVPKQTNWFLREWMEACGLRGRGNQARMMELTGWSRATMSQLYNGEQDYSPKIINETAKALEVEPWELLMHPDRAYQIRRIRGELIRLARENDADDLSYLDRPEYIKAIDNDPPSRGDEKPAKPKTGTDG